MDRQRFGTPLAHPWGWAGGLSRQSRKHRPPIHWERSLELTIHWENEEDVMGRLVVGTGEEVGGKACFFIVFSTFLVALGKKNQPKSQQKSKPKKKTKNNKKLPKTDHRLFALGAQNGPKMDKKRARSRKSASGGGAGSYFFRSLPPSLFGVTPRTEFWRV